MIVIDYSQIAISAILANTSPDTTLTTDLVRHMILNTIRSYKTKFAREYGQLVIAVDSRNYWRKQAFLHYKANRKKIRQESSIDWPALFEAVAQVKQELAEIFPYPVIEVNGAEADDVIATLVLWTQENGLEENSLLDTSYPQPILIVSGDHDFQQLQKYSNVSQFVPTTKSLVKANNPENLLLEHIIRGDAGDGVPNFLSDDDTFVDDNKKQRSIMAKNISIWLNMSFNEIAEDASKSMRETYEKSLKLYEKAIKKYEAELKNNKDHEHLSIPKKPIEPPTKEELLRNLERNKQLVDLTQIPEDVSTQIIQNFEQQRFNQDKSKIFKYMSQNKLMVLLESIGDF